MSDDDDLFGSSGKYRSLSFKLNAGEALPKEYRDLTVLEPARKVAQRDPATGEVKYFLHKSGPLAGQSDTTAPIYQWVYKVRLPQGFRPDPDVVAEYGEDDGERNLYVGGKVEPSSKSSRAALVVALRKAGVKRVEVGGVINRFAFVAEGPQTNRAFNPPKLYEATYTPPAPGSGTAVSNGASSSSSAVDDSEPPF